MHAHSLTKTLGHCGLYTDKQAKEGLSLTRILIYISEHGNPDRWLRGASCLKVNFIFIIL